MCKCVIYIENIEKIWFLKLYFCYFRKYHDIFQPWWQECIESEITAGRESFAREVNSFSDKYNSCSEGRQTRQMATSAEIQQLTRDVQQLETGLVTM